MEIMEQKCCIGTKSQNGILAIDAILWCKHITKKTKCQVYNIIVKIIVTRGCEV